MIQAVIEDAGHRVIFLPKFHCELNPIEFLWGAAKRFTRGEYSVGDGIDSRSLASDPRQRPRSPLAHSPFLFFRAEHCEYNFKSLKRMVPISLHRVELLTIRRWECRMWRWIEAYDQGFRGVAAADKVKEFAEKKYKSHRGIPDSVADAI